MTNETTKPDLVFGASGYIGTNLVEFLLAEGRSVRASSRNVEVLRGRGWEGAELCGADALDPEQLDAVLENVDTAYYLVHPWRREKHSPKSTRSRHATLPLQPSGKLCGVSSTWVG